DALSPAGDGGADVLAQQPARPWFAADLEGARDARVLRCNADHVGQTGSDHARCSHRRPLRNASGDSRLATYVVELSRANAVRLSTSRSSFGEDPHRSGRTAAWQVS